MDPLLPQRFPEDGPRSALERLALADTDSRSPSPLLPELGRPMHTAAHGLVPAGTKVTV